MEELFWRPRRGEEPLDRKLPERLHDTLEKSLAHRWGPAGAEGRKDISVEDLARDQLVFRDHLVVVLGAKVSRDIGVAILLLQFSSTKQAQNG